MEFFPLAAARRVAGGLAFAAVAWLLFGGVALAQGSSPLLEGYRIKVGAGFADSFIRITRKSDNAEARLITDTDASPYVSFSSPPLFFGSSGLAFGVSASYNEFSAERQSFTGGAGPEATGSVASGQLVTLTPELLYFIGRNSPTQYLRFALGVGWGVASFSGFVRFGDTLAGSLPEPFESPSGTINAVAFSVEYRYKALSVGYSAGGPAAENDVHSFQWGENTLTVAYVYSL